MRQISGHRGVTGKTSGKLRGAAPARRSGAAPRAGLEAGPQEPRVDAPAAARLGWREAITATVTGLGYELVDVERAPRGLLRVTIDRVPGRAYERRHGGDAAPDTGEFVTVDDCEQVTRQLQYALEVEGLEYSRLEVSSPGLDRPLKTEADLRRFAGQAASVVLRVPFQGRKVWKGVLAVADGGGFSLALAEGKVAQQLDFKFDEVREARLVPVVDFKGRKSRGDAPDSGRAGAAPVEAAASGEDGG